jgi:mannose-6-phosphate isomerase
MSIPTRNVVPNSEFANGEYRYYTVTLQNQKIVLDDYKERTIFCIEGIVDCNRIQLKAGDSLQSKNTPNKIQGNGVVMIAEVTAIGDDSWAERTSAGYHYKVSKPWGYELWVNGEHPQYSFKKIFIKAGTQTSLQYHNFKEETNVIMEGSAVLVTKKTDIPNDDVTPADLLEQEIRAPFSIHVLPKTIHRLRAITDLMLYEVSTPFLNDVIRLLDDVGRGNGRIDEEHAK